MGNSDASQRMDTANRVIQAEPQALYRAFADGDTLMQWLPPGGMQGRALEYDFREGGRYRIELRYVGDGEAAGKSSARSDISHGRFEELVEGERIRQTVRFESDDPAFHGEMTMTWTFAPEANGTRVTVTAEHVPPGITPEDHAQGLNASLDNLAAFVQPGKA